jgi:hypothetical protein
MFIGFYKFFYFFCKKTVILESEIAQNFGFRFYIRTDVRLLFLLFFAPNTVHKVVVVYEVTTLFFADESRIL